MRTFNKMLLAIYDEDLNCYAPKGSWLYIADKKDTKKRLFRLPHYLYYFVSLDKDRVPAEIGVVKVLPEPITALDLAKRDFESRGLSSSTIGDDTIKEYELFLEKVNGQPEHTPMAVTWLDKPISNSKELRVHKKFFTGLSKEEKKAIFEDE